jgi:predicted MFS family arabinose efflux permease
VVFTDLESALILLATGFAMATFYAISTGASQNFHEVYGFDDLHVSLMFLPLGVGGIIATFTTGKLVDWLVPQSPEQRQFED